VPLDYEEPFPIVPDLCIEVRRHLEPLEAVGALALAQQDVARRIARQRAIRMANLLVDLPQQSAAFTDDVDRGPLPLVARPVSLPERKIGER
jgi:hypothetical protein